MAYGLPAQTTPRAKVVLAQDLGMGVALNVAAPNLPLGASPSAQNVLARDGGVEPRMRMGQVGTNNVFSDVGMYIGEYSTVTGGKFTVAMSARTFAYLVTQTWTAGSYSTQPTNDPLSGGDTDYMDAAVVYHPTPDENGLVFVNGVDRAFFWGGPSSATYSTLTNAPIAKTVTVFDSRVVFGNLTDTSTATRLVQRIQWSARGDPETYSEPTGGAEDLLDARGAITRIVGAEDRLLVFFEHEIWVGLKADFPFDLQFIPLDRTVGCLAPWSVTQTPKGVAFLGNDNQPYLIPKGGTPVAIGGAVWRTIRENIDRVERTAGGFDPNVGEYLVAFCKQGGTGRPERGVSVNIETGTWAPHTYQHTPTRLGLTTLASSGTTFGGLVGTFAQQMLTYGELAGSAGQRVMCAITSEGTGAQFSSTATGDLGAAVDVRYATGLQGADPTKRYFLNEVRLDYRAASSSSVTLRLSSDWGASAGQEIGVALPSALVSGQTVIPCGFGATYPSVQLQHDQGHRFAVNRVSAIAVEQGRA